MDIKNKFRQALAGAATLALLASNATVAFAGTYFDDVSNDVKVDWFAPYVNQLAEDGVVDTGPANKMFRPNDAGNRAEEVKMAVEVAGLLDGFDVPTKPTFSDVPVDAWYFKYVEAAAASGIVGGYTDANNNPTGKFGPGDTMTRAAATKVISLTFQLTEDGVGALPFSDVKGTDWFYKYVQAAYGWSVVDGYKDAQGSLTGKFGPGDAVTRAQWAKMLTVAQNPVWRGGVAPKVCADGEYKDSKGMCVPVPTCAAGEYFNTDTEKCEVVATSKGDLMLSLNPSSPGLGKITTLPLGAQNVELLKVDVKAVGDAVQLTQLKVTRLGVGDATDFDELFFYNGNTRLGSGKTVNSDTNQATFNFNGFVIPKDTMVTLTLVGSVSASAASTNQDQFSVAVATDVSSNAVSVKGTYPATGGTFQMGSVSVSSVTLSAVTISRPTIGEKDAEIGAFKITNDGVNDVAVERITVTNNGTFDSADFSSLRLLAGSDEVATAESFTKDTVTFVLTKPYQIDSGQNRTFYVHANINGGNSKDSIELYVDELTDVKVTDLQYGFGAQVVNSTFTIAGVEAVNLEGGDLVLVDNSAPSTQIAVNSTEQALTEFAITADRDLTVRDTNVKLEIQDGNGNVPDLEGTLTNYTTTGLAVRAGVNANEYYVTTTANATTMLVGDMVKLGGMYGRVVANDGNTTNGIPDADLTVYSNNTLTGYTGSVNEVNPYSFIKNVKLVDTDTNNTLAGPLTLASQGTPSVGLNTAYTKTFSEDYDLMGGKTRNLAVVADIDQNMVSGFRLRATVEYLDSYVKDQNANEFLLAEEIVGSPLAGNLMSIEENTLNVNISSAPISQDYVLGQTGVDVLGISLQGGDAGDTKVRKIVLRAYGEDGLVDGEFADLNGDGSANLLVSSVSLYNGNTLVAGPKGLSAAGTAPNDYDTVTFDQLALVIAKGQNLNLTVKANLLNTKTGIIAFDVVPSTDITAEDVDNNTISLSSTAINTYAANHFAVEHQVIDAGTLAVSEAGSPTADIAVAGTNEMLVAKYTFQATKEKFDVNKFTVINDLSGAFDAAETTSAVSAVTVKYPNDLGVMQTKTVSMTAGAANFSGMDFIVQKNPPATLEIYANVSPVNQAIISGKTFRLGLKDTLNTQSTFEAVGMASSNTVTSGIAITGSAGVAQFTVRKTVPVLTQTNLVGSLDNTEVDLYDVKVTADPKGPVYIARMVFDVSTLLATPAGADLTNFSVLRDGVKLQPSEVNIFCDNTFIKNLADDADDATSLEACDAGGNNGTLTNQTYKVIVSFNQQQTVSAGSPRTYVLRANVAGVTANSNDKISTRLATGDEFVALTGLNDATNANTGKVYFSNDATKGIFAVNGSGLELSATTGTARNFIWSDGSADIHTYPTVAAGDVVSDSGSADFTNGYLLQISSLTSKNLNSN